MSNCEANEEAFPDGTLVVPITVLGNQNPAVDTELRESRVSRSCLRQTQHWF